jgi:AcrR family transcriptional regulator
MVKATLMPKQAKSRSGTVARRPSGGTGPGRAGKAPGKPAAGKAPVKAPVGHSKAGKAVAAAAAGSAQGKPAEPAKRARARKVDADTRRQAILDAALSVFAEHGFEAARLDEMAARAGVAKGTLYLYFQDKEALFEELIRGAAAPIIDTLSKVAANPAIPPAMVLEAFFGMFEKEVLGTRRKLLLRLIIAEGPRFPAIAEFYYREVVSRGIQLMRGVAERAAASGEFASEAPARFPQLIVAPLLVAVLWDGMFSKINPLDVGGLLRAHRELLCGKPQGSMS